MSRNKELIADIKLNEIGGSFRNKRKSNQVVHKKRLLFDKIHNEHLSTSDFLDTSIDPIQMHSNKHSNFHKIQFAKTGGYKLKDHNNSKTNKYIGLNSSFEEESIRSGKF
jgi:hypothetical protein